jgi:hypothetical protein
MNDLDLLHILQNPDKISSISDPDPITQFLSVSHDPKSYSKLSNPCREIDLLISIEGPNLLSKAKLDTIPVEFMEYSIKRSYDNFQYYANKVSKETQLKVLSRHGHLLKFIDNPSDELKLCAINSDFNIIKSIKGVTHEMQLLAVKRSWGQAIEFIDNPCEEACMQSVKLDYRNIKLIKNPNKEMAIMVLKRDGKHIDYLHTKAGIQLDEDIQMAALSYQYTASFVVPYILKYVGEEKMSTKVKNLCTKYSPSSIELFKEPTNMMKKLAVKANPMVITKIKNPSESIQVLAVTINFEVIHYIKDPSEDVQVAAVIANKRAIKLIKKPCMQASLLAS